jgi:hypothetical protein
MSKVTRPKLTRGTKLKQEHIHGVLTDVASEINAATVTVDQTPKASAGVFRLNFHIPVLDSRFLVIGQSSSGHVATTNQYAIPFTLPPSQEHFSTIGAVGDPPRFKVDKSVPRLILDEFSFSFDQGSAAASRVDYHFNTTTYAAGTNEGCLDFEEAEAYSLELSLAEKNQWYFTANGAGDNTASLRHPQKTIFTLPIDGAAFVSKVNKPNPVVIPDINHVMRPFTTYILMISAPSLTTVGKTANYAQSPFALSPDRSHALYSVQFSLKVKSDMDRRDVYNAGTNSIRNYPTKDSGTANTIRSRAVTGNSISISAPVADATIAADGSTGVNTNLQLIDQALRDKFSGGFNDRSETAATQELYADSCYEVLTVPLFNNAANQVYDADTANSNGAYANVAKTAGGTYQSIADRRIIPIREPMVVHHVILARSFMQPSKMNAGGGNPYPEGDANAVNVFTNIGMELGVGIGSGLRSDHAAYINLAYAKSDDASMPQFGTIDVIAPASQTTGSSTNFRHDLLHVPLSYLATGALGKGYYSNGLPIFIGKSWDPTATRTQSVSNATGALSAPATGGREQFIEVRMRIFNTAGNIEDGSKTSMYVGYGGYWLYIIGKKYLTKGFHGNVQGE